MINKLHGVDGCGRLKWSIIKKSCMATIVKDRKP